MDSTKLKITPEEKFLNRRVFMNYGIWGSLLMGYTPNLFGSDPKNVKENDPGLKKDSSSLSLEDQITKEEVATSYNNFYEFSLDKAEVKPKVENWKLTTEQWRVEVGGLIEKTKSYSIEELISLAGGLQEERIYRFRCVEAWSMVVPWTGFPLSNLVKALKPKKEAKFIKFYSLADSKQMPNISKLPQYPWPYTEGLTIEEALNPLTLIATGMYKKPLPKQNGAPIRLVVPWKYGFKSIKSIVKIEFTDKQPSTLWNDLAPAEYGFYANVNPEVAHPRWSQASERILDTSFLPKKKKTLMFNGYEKEVAHLYAGLDLKKNY